MDYVDTFTRDPFAGNPCAVLFDAQGLTDEQMQKIAREVNLPETVFVLPSSRADMGVRYFTPRLELPFAGHPTLAVGYTLALERMITLEEPMTTIHLESKVGVLPVEICVADGEPRRVIVTQQGPTFGEMLAAGDVAPCLGLEDSDLRSDCPPQVVGTGVPFLIVPARQVSVLGALRMDRNALKTLCDRLGVSAAFVFSIGGLDPKADTHGRLMDPRGTMEDPFTGSATGAMGAYVIRYALKSGPVLVAEQGHFVGRPGLGVLEIGIEDGKIDSVKLGGAAVRVLSGMLFIYGAADETESRGDSCR